MKFSFRLWRPVLPVLMAALLATGCVTGLGPKAIREDRPDYNQQIVRSGDEQMLLNLVRIRYNDTPLFLELGSVVTSYGYDAAVNAGGQLNTGPTTGQGNLGAALSYSEHPTITYTPLTGDQFAERLLSPVPLDSVMLFSQSGWSTKRLMLVTVLRMNDLFNVPTASGPTPARAPDYERFLDFTRRFQALQDAGLVGLNWERQMHETNVPGREPHFWIRLPADPNSPLAADALSVRRDLELESGRSDFLITAFPFHRQPDELGIRCRSLMGILFFLSTSVEPPPPHVQEGLLTVTRNSDGTAFDWHTLSGEVMTIHSRRDKPPRAAVAVRYRDWWFYIADDDQNSKVTFNLLNILFQLQASTGSGKSPLLTLPVGQ
ncbi:MAG: hypothetical protein U1F98_11840 [Verrucomicrobiota bacterium]